MFANADFAKNKTVYLTVICVCVIYLALIVYARYQDKKDIEKLGITPLPDNHQVDRYFYQIIVFTGQRKNAGTLSKVRFPIIVSCLLIQLVRQVHFILGGDDDETNVRTLADPRRKILQRGGIDAFVMAVPKYTNSVLSQKSFHLLDRWDH